MVDWTPVFIIAILMAPAVVLPLGKWYMKARFGEGAKQLDNKQQGQQEEVNREMLAELKRLHEGMAGLEQRLNRLENQELRREREKLASVGNANAIETDESRPISSGATTKVDS